MKNEKYMFVELSFVELCNVQDLETEMDNPKSKRQIDC